MFKPNGISHSYHLEKSISNYRVVGFQTNFNSTFCKQTVKNLIRRRVLKWVDMKSYYWNKMLFLSFIEEKKYSFGGYRAFSAFLFGLLIYVWPCRD